jgi:hypothetical protein
MRVSHSSQRPGRLVLGACQVGARSSKRRVWLLACAAAGLVSPGPPVAPV